ncbi:MAG: phospho-N-acetylmuramoyl-pentapeptide-transferase, partial [Lentisphaerae bacterium]|nr:phospho-N-acetylmuramoyl-pentapeptide-transferase [Lentisphaerota bacterium]
MLYYLHLLSEAEWLSPLRVFRYITVRSVAAAGTAFIIGLAAGPWVIEQLRRLKIRQYERREDVAPLYSLHAHKEGTPTMGGLLIIASTLTATMLWARPDSFFVWLVVATMVFMGLIGLLDDYKKTAEKNAKGLRARNKFALQVLWAVIVFVALLGTPETRLRVRQLMVPFFKDPVITNMGLAGAALFAILVIVGVSNAVNLTDGLDGLAIGCSGSVAFSYLVMAYVAGHSAFAEYLRIPYVRGSGELAVFCASLLGSCLAFLWYNCHPASVFMGDTGSLAIGGAIAMVALLIKQEILLIIVGGVFVVEAMSVILQVAYFKLRQKRLFAMAPI